MIFKQELSPQNCRYTPLLCNFIWDGWNMLFQMIFSRTSVITNVAFEWLNYFKNWCNMLVHVILYRTFIVTNIAFICFCSFMNLYSMFFQSMYSFVNIGSQSKLSHLKGLFPSWTDRRATIQPVWEQS